MNSILQDPRFAGIEPFEKKVWDEEYYWGNQEEKPWFTRVFERLSPILKLQFSISGSRFENLERLMWLLGYSWIDPQYRVENSIKEVWLSPHVSLRKRWAICCVWESLCPRIQYSMNLDNIQAYKTNNFSNKMMPLYQVDMDSHVGVWNGMRINMSILISKELRHIVVTKNYCTVWIWLTNWTLKYERSYLRLY